MVILYRNGVSQKHNSFKHSLLRNHSKFILGLKTFRELGKSGKEIVV